MANPRKKAAELFNQNVNKRGLINNRSKAKSAESNSSLGPVMIAFFVFVVVAIFLWLLKMMEILLKLYEIDSSVLISQSSQAFFSMVDHVFSILPFGLQPEFDIDGWESEVADTALSEMIIVEDLQLKSEVIELTCDTFYKVAMSFPDESKIIGTPFPYVTLHLKNLNKFVAFEIEIEDSSGIKRTIRSSSAQSLARCKDNLATIPMHLVPGWNCIILDLQTLCLLLFGTNLRHTIRVRVFANCRLRRIYFHDQIIQEHELPRAVRVFPDIDIPVPELEAARYPLTGSV